MPDEKTALPQNLGQHMHAQYLTILGCNRQTLRRSKHRHHDFGVSVASLATSPQNRGVQVLAQHS